MKTVRKKIVIVGAGPAGVGAAVRLARDGHNDLMILDRFDRVGGISGKYTEHGRPTFIVLSKGRVVHGPRYADLLSDRLHRAGVEPQLGTSVIRFNPEMKELQVLSKQDGVFCIKADVILFACGARERSSVERGHIYGQRPARAFHTLQLLQLLRKTAALPVARTGIVGSEVVSYSTADKLKVFSGRPLIFDHGKSASCSMLSRFYFFRGQQPKRIPDVRELRVAGNMSVETIQAGTEVPAVFPMDYLFLCGQLVPNTELLAIAKVPFDAKTRVIAADWTTSMQEKGLFLAGNIRGTGSGSERAYLCGSLTGRRITAYLS